MNLIGMFNAAMKISAMVAALATVRAENLTLGWILALWIIASVFMIGEISEDKG